MLVSTSVHNGRRSRESGRVRGVEFRFTAFFQVPRAEYVNAEFLVRSDALELYLARMLLIELALSMPHNTISPFSNPLLLLLHQRKLEMLDQKHTY